MLLAFIIKKIMLQEINLFWEKVVQDVLLRDSFIEPPFSILDAKQWWWQKRKREWKKIWMQSEVWRDATTFNMKIWADKKSIEWKMKWNKLPSDVSIFDPALCEVLYHWFCVKWWTILDPFAWWSVRWIVANKLGYKYTWIDIRQEQIESNQEQWLEILWEENLPTWVVWDSNIVLDEIEERFDMVFSCPPYADLEVYSDLEWDISNKPYNEFMVAYESIINKSCKLLKSWWYACFVVWEVRDKQGNYIWFVPDTIKAFIKDWMYYYNEAILLNSIASASIRANWNMKSKKLVKIHQNILVFKKP